jgi:transposase
MAKPYSQDLRDRVIDAVKRGEMSLRAAARRYEISESVAIQWLERVERDGSREPVGHGGPRASKLMPHRHFLEARGPRNRTSRFRPLWLEHPLAREVDVIALPLPSIRGAILCLTNQMPQTDMLIYVGIDAFRLDTPSG